MYGSGLALKQHFAGRRIISTEKRSPRLTKADWTQAGITALAGEGFTAVRADTLAKKLGVSRGSFYWHFEDVAAYETALVAHWHQMAISAVRNVIEAGGTPTERFRDIMRLALFSINKVEIAMRAWSTVNPRIREALKPIDEARIENTVKLVAAVSALPPERIRAKAIVVYWTYLGHAVTHSNAEADLEPVIDELVAMIEEK